MSWHGIHSSQSSHVSYEIDDDRVVKGWDRRRDGKCSSSSSDSSSSLNCKPPDPVTWIFVSDSLLSSSDAANRSASDFFLRASAFFVLRSLWPVLVLWHVVASTFFFPSSLFHQKPSCPSRRPCRFSIKSLQGSRIIGRFKVGSLHFKRWTFNTVYIITMHLFVNFYHSRAAHYS